MAIWQFKFSLVPADGIRRVHGSDLSTLTIHQVSTDGSRLLDDVEYAVLPKYWDNPASLQRIALAISELLPEMKSWSSDARMFGEKGGNEIEVWDDDVSCHIDMRNCSEMLLTLLIRLARKFDCKLAIHGPGTVIDADMPALAREISASSAYRFCLDPEGYLRGLKNEEHGHP